MMDRASARQISSAHERSQSVGRCFLHKQQEKSDGQNPELLSVMALYAPVAAGLVERRGVGGQGVDYFLGGLLLHTVGQQRDILFSEPSSHGMSGTLVVMRSVRAFLGSLCR